MVSRPGSSPKSKPGGAPSRARERAGEPSSRYSYPSNCGKAIDHLQNRLLHMIRQQQAQIQTLQSVSHGGSAVVDDSTPPTPQPALQTSSSSRPRSPFMSHSLSRTSSHRSNGGSITTSPSLMPSSGFGDANDLLLGPSAIRDESAFYQAETQTLTRENQMLKLRIRELGQCCLFLSGTYMANGI
jgi:hypothetical protein